MPDPRSSSTDAPAQAARANPEQLSAAIEGFSEESGSALLYAQLAKIERDPRIAAMYAELGQAAGRQAAIWGQRLGEAGVAQPPVPDLDARARAALWLAARIGVRPMRGVFSAMKVRGLSAYENAAPAGHPRPTAVGEIGRRHRTGAGNLRAAVFGVNDGLVSNASLIMGMAGAAAEPRTLLLAGIAGLLAGAFSMAAGEYISVRSQREVFEYQIGLERAELEEYPEAEAEELAIIYQAKGLSADEARAIAGKLIADPERALDTLAREELGLNPDELGSPWGAALSSFAAFAAGAAIPLVPFLATPGGSALAWSVGLAAASLFGVGALLSWFTGRNAWLSGLRMLGIGAIAGAATWGIGRLVGVAVA